LYDARAFSEVRPSGRTKVNEAVERVTRYLKGLAEVLVLVGIDGAVPSRE
jgi:hypothetical protein